MLPNDLVDDRLFSVLRTEGPMLEVAVPRCVYGRTIFQGTYVDL